MTDHDHMQRARARELLEEAMGCAIGHNLSGQVSMHAALDAIAAALRGQSEAAQAVPEDPWCEAVMSGSLVYAALGEDARSRTSVENVCDVLDAIARVARQLAAAPKPEGR